MWRFYNDKAACINAHLKYTAGIIAPIEAAPQPCLPDAVRQGSEGIAYSGTNAD